MMKKKSLPNLFSKAKALLLFTLAISVVMSFKSDVIQSETIGTMEVLNGMLKSISNVKTLRYTLHRNERVKGKMSYTESKVKLQTSPRKLYINVNGQEVLWIAGANNGDALINPGAFPYVNVNLDPMGSLMRKTQHHTINELGMDYLATILKGAMQHYGDKFEKYFSFLGEEKWNGRTCYKLSASFTDFAWSSYTLKKGETLLSVATKKNLSEFMILEKNPQITWFDGGTEGQTIQIPNAYAKIILLLIDKEYMLPINETILDDVGLFENYEYHDLKVNIPIAAEEFTKEYKDYHF